MRNSAEWPGAAKNPEYQRQNHECNAAQRKDPRNRFALGPGCDFEQRDRAGKAGTSFPATSATLHRSLEVTGGHGRPRCGLGTDPGSHGDKRPAPNRRIAEAHNMPESLGPCDRRRRRKGRTAVTATVTAPIRLFPSTPLIPAHQAVSQTFIPSVTRRETPPLPSEAPLTHSALPGSAGPALSRQPPPSIRLPPSLRPPLRARPAFPAPPAPPRHSPPAHHRPAGLNCWPRPSLPRKQPLPRPSASRAPGPPRSRLPASPPALAVHSAAAPQAADSDTSRSDPLRPWRPGAARCHGPQPCARAQAATACQTRWPTPGRARTGACDPAERRRCPRGSRANIAAGRREEPRAAPGPCPSEGPEARPRRVLTNRLRPLAAPQCGTPYWRVSRRAVLVVRRPSVCVTVIRRLNRLAGPTGQLVPPLKMKRY